MSKKTKADKVTIKNPVAQELRSNAAYRKQVIRNKKTYTRKTKHKGGY